MENFYLGPRKIYQILFRNLFGMMNALNLTIIQYTIVIFLNKTSNILVTFFKIMIRWEVGKIWEQSLIRMTTDNFVGFKLSKQSFRLLNILCGNSIRNLLIKNHQFCCIEKLMGRKLQNMATIFKRKWFIRPQKNIWKNQKN